MTTTTFSDTPIARFCPPKPTVGDFVPVGDDVLGFAEDFSLLPMENPLLGESIVFFLGGVLKQIQAYIYPL